jgi:hypothetical protein
MFDYLVSFHCSNPHLRICAFAHVSSYARLFICREFS